jgi:acyl dehydratase
MATTEVLPVQAGDTWSKDFCVGSDEEIRAFARLIGDTNPLHHNEEVAKQKGLLGIIAPGVMLLGFISATIAEKIPGALARKIELDFTNPAYGESFATVRCRMTNLRGPIAMLEVTVRNGCDILAAGIATLVLPKERR